MLAVLWERHCRPIVLLVPSRPDRPTSLALALAAPLTDHTVIESIDRSCTTRHNCELNANLSGGASVSVRRVSGQCVRTSVRCPRQKHNAVTLASSANV